MIIRKPTKIDLKPEDDLNEYEEYKKNQNEIMKLNKRESNLKNNKM
jgi:hypothetical protein